MASTDRARCVQDLQSIIGEHSQILLPPVVVGAEKRIIEYMVTIHVLDFQDGNHQTIQIS
jgi:hypothetical protein